MATNIDLLYMGKTGGMPLFVHLATPFETVSVTRVTRNVGPDKIVTSRKEETALRVSEDGLAQMELTRKNCEVIKSLTSSDLWELVDPDQMALVDAMLAPTPVATEAALEGTGVAKEGRGRVRTPQTRVVAL
jgi:hypothetical protein